MLMIILEKDIDYNLVPINRTPEYWAGWVLANAQWYLNKTFKEIISVMPLSTLINMYYPYHEADEMKIIEKIKELESKRFSVKRSTIFVKDDS